MAEKSVKLTKEDKAAQKRTRADNPPLPNVKVLSQQALDLIRKNKKFFAVFTLAYALLNLLFIQSSNGFDLRQAQELVGNSVGGTLPTSLALYSELIGSSTKLKSQTASLYQFIIVFLFSLALIYGIRHMYGQEAKKVSVKTAFYKGMTPVVPVLFVLMVLALQLLPLSIGSGLYSTVVNGGLAVNTLEQILWLVFVISTALLSLYLVSGSLFALIIVTLPDMKPIQALRSSRELVRFRRLQVIRKLVFIALALLVVLGIFVVPFIAFVPSLAQAAFFIASMVALPLALTYLYSLYRNML